ncbi:MAG: ribonuclease HI family protein [Methanobacteriota archaeon]
MAAGRRRSTPGLAAVRLYADGGARGNPGPAAIGVVLCDDRDRVLLERKEYIGKATNNEAEYRAIIAGLSLAARATRTDVRVHSDRELVVRHLTGAYRLRSGTLRPLYKRAKEKEKAFRKVTYEHLPRLTSWLRRADKLVNEALDDAGH